MQYEYIMYSLMDKIVINNWRDWNMQLNNIYILHLVHI